MTHEGRDSLIDQLLEAYLEWCEESAAVGSAYRRWSLASADDASARFAAYVAALDREERASDVYARLFGRTRAARLRGQRIEEWRLREAA
jgi:hypothetical protein